ncbi:MAG: ribosomal protein S18-alanine N-acetyltransferase [Actinomycetota bacterium]
MAFLELKKLTAQQLLAAVELDQLCFGGLWTLSGYQRELESPNSDLLGLWRSQSNQVGDRSSEGEALVALGCQWAIVDEAHITLVAVHPQFQGQGLGQAMLYALLKAAWQRQLQRATLEVKASNLPALSLYQKFGFQEAGRRRHYYTDTDEDAVILWRGGLSHPLFPQDLEQWEQQLIARLQQNDYQLLSVNP